MTQKQMVLEAIQELPEDASVRQIADRLEFLAAIQVGKPKPRHLALGESDVL